MNGEKTGWFPGHMAKAERQMASAMKLTDAVVEILDARIPRSSRNQDLDKIAAGKPRVLLLNKCDLADAAETARWLAVFRRSGAAVLAVDCRTGKNVGAVLPAVRRLLLGRLASWRAKGMAGRRIRVMTAGIPNVGKSSLINRLARSSGAKVENRPGVTLSSQWYSIGGGFELLDTPGVLRPKTGPRQDAGALALTGAVRDDILDGPALACSLIGILSERYPELLAKRYRLEPGSVRGSDGESLLKRIAGNRGMLLRGGTADMERAARMLIEEFRCGKIGRITLERAGEK